MLAISTKPACPPVKANQGLAAPERMTAPFPQRQGPQGPSSLKASLLQLQLHSSATLANRKSWCITQATCCFSAASFDVAFSTATLANRKSYCIIVSAASSSPALSATSITSCTCATKAHPACCSPPVLRLATRHLQGWKQMLPGSSAKNPSQNAIYSVTNADLFPVLRRTAGL